MIFQMALLNETERIEILMMIEHGMRDAKYEHFLILLYVN